MKTRLGLILRRAAIVVAVVGSLVLGAATIRAASQWTASEAPLAAPPVTVETVSAQLAAERQRSADLESRLGSMTGQATELQAALDAANAQIQTDTATAGDLQKRIAAAKKKLATLNRQIAATERQAAAARAAARTVVVTRSPARTPAPAPVTREPADDD